MWVDGVDGGWWMVDEWMSGWMDEVDDEWWVDE